MSVRESMPQVARTSMGTHAAVAWEWRRVTKIGALAVKRSPHAQAVGRGQAAAISATSRLSIGFLPHSREPGQAPPRRECNRRAPRGGRAGRRG